MSPIGQGSADPYSFAPPQTGHLSKGASQSLWRDQSASLFRDRRDMMEGDLVTVLIEINDQAALDNKSSRSRNGSVGLGLSGSTSLAGGSGGANFDLSGDGNSKSAGEGKVTRSERIRLRVAALVTAVLPNGNLIVAGQQEVRVNNEMRVLAIQGIIRPADVSSDNTIVYDKIAEARISYGGEGRLSEVQRPTLVHQIYDRVTPF